MAIALAILVTAITACAQSALPSDARPARALPASVVSTRKVRMRSQLFLRDVSILRGKTSVEVHIEASGLVKPVAMVVPNPERIVVDLAGVGYDGNRRLPVHVGGVETVRAALFQADPPVTRVVVDLDHPHEYRLLPAGRTVILAVDTSPKQASAAQPAAMVRAAATLATPAATLPATSAETSSASSAPPLAQVAMAELSPQPEASAPPPVEAASLRVALSEPAASTTLSEVATTAVADPTKSGAAEEQETTPHQAAKGNKPGVVRSVTVSHERNAIELYIEGNKPLRASASTLSNPERIIIDLSDVGVLRPRRIPVNAADVQTVGASLYLVNPLVTRVVVNLTRPHSFHMRTSGNSLTLRIETDTVKAAGFQSAR